MDAERFETLLRSLHHPPSRRDALRLLAGSTLGGLLTLGMRPAEAKKGGKGKGKGKKGKNNADKKVTICHNGQTLSISQSALQAHLGHGDAVGDCPPPSPPPPPLPPLPIFTLAAKEMTGAKEIPAGSGDPIGSGSAQFTIQGSTICGTFQFSSTTPNSTVTGTHIHAGASDAEGGIVVDFTPVGLGQPKCVPCPGTICDQIKATPAAFYANIHTGAFTAGAVRAQLE